MQIEHNFSASNYKLDSITKYLFDKNFKCIYYTSNVFSLKKPVKEFENQSFEIFAFNKKFFKTSELNSFIKKNNSMLNNI